MTTKKTKNNPQSKSTRALQIMFIVFSIILILSMVLSAFIKTR